MADAPLRELLELERRLLRAGPGCPRACAEALLSSEFVEFGASGRVWTRAAILMELERCGERSDEVADATCTVLCADTALLLYRIPADRESLRSSVWVQREGRWQMLFHQGTLVTRT